MLNLQTKFEALMEDVNKEDGQTVQMMENFLGGMFFLIKWAGIPFVLYLLFAATRL
ncbi:hypothetical protein PH210_24745 [Paenibacillus sp. BSR1-1]|uniref:hypothetical protein n=1 Tax=Paenibacillus sp. BSR1-1 TaxID=3020845 RepID=UPI0025B1CA70|nr:hypothetical protein [Paenibacillus sp. BSR1-1]MDN3019385.1 hypothetical protein [Paenibacillus sp. BSR1-1]